LKHMVPYSFNPFHIDTWSIKVPKIITLDNENRRRFTRMHTIFPCVNTKMWYRRESYLWAQLGEKIHPEEGRPLQKDSAEELAVGSLLSFGKGTVCADFAGLRGDVARAEGTNRWISIRTLESFSRVVEFFERVNRSVDLRKYRQPCIMSSIMRWI
jgi:hypothetical protein